MFDKRSKTQKTLPLSFLKRIYLLVKLFNERDLLVNYLMNVRKSRNSLVGWI